MEPKFAIGQIVAMRLDGNRVMITNVFKAMTNDQPHVYEIRTDCFNKFQVNEFELEELV